MSVEGSWLSYAQQLFDVSAVAQGQRLGNRYFMDLEYGDLRLWKWCWLRRIAGWKGFWVSMAFMIWAQKFGTSLWQAGLRLPIGVSSSCLDWCMFSQLQDFRSFYIKFYHIIEFKSYPLSNQHNYWKSPFLMGKLTISMAMFHMSVKHRLVLWKPRNVMSLPFKINLGPPARPTPGGWKMLSINRQGSRQTVRSMSP